MRSASRKSSDAVAAVADGVFDDRTGQLDACGLELLVRSSWLGVRAGSDAAKLV